MSDRADGCGNPLLGGYGATVKIGCDIRHETVCAHANCNGTTVGPEHNDRGGYRTDGVEAVRRRGLYGPTV